MKMNFPRGYIKACQIGQMRDLSDRIGALIKDLLEKIKDDEVKIT